MYIRYTNDGSYESTYGERNPRDDFYHIGNVAWYDRWAVRRMSASYTRYIWQNITLTAVIIGLYVWSWIQLAARFGGLNVLPYGMAITFATLIFLVVFGAMKEVYPVSLLYSWLAGAWLSRKSFESRTVTIAESSLLQILVAQVRNKKVEVQANSYDNVTMKWLESHPQFHPVVDRMLGSKWLTDAQAALKERPSAPDKAADEKFSLLETRIREHIWPFAEEIIEVERATAEAQQTALDLEVNNLLETVDQLTDDEAGKPASQWQQPRTTGPVRTQPNQR